MRKWVRAGEWKQRDSTLSFLFSSAQGHSRQSVSLRPDADLSGSKQQNKVMLTKTQDVPSNNTSWFKWDSCFTARGNTKLKYYYLVISNVWEISLSWDYEWVVPCESLCVCGCVCVYVCVCVCVREREECVYHHFESARETYSDRTSPGDLWSMEAVLQFLKPQGIQHCIDKQMVVASILGELQNAFYFPPKLVSQPHNEKGKKRKIIPHCYRNAILLSSQQVNNVFNIFTCSKNKKKTSSMF